MHKKIEAELVSIAHGILQMKNKGDVVALQQRAKDAYEKLSVLAFVDRYLQTTPNVAETKEEILEKITQQRGVQISRHSQRRNCNSGSSPKRKEKESSTKKQACKTKPAAAS